MNEKKEQGKSKRGLLNEEELKIIDDVKFQREYTLDELVKIFIEDAEFRNLREHTIKYYRNELNAFKNLLIVQQIDTSINQISAEVIKRNEFYG